MKIYVTDASLASSITQQEQEPNTINSKYNSKGVIPVRLSWSPFSNLLVVIRYHEHPATHAYSQVDVSMKQAGWGLEGLIVDNASFITVHNVVEFDIDFTLKMKMPAVGMLTLPGDIYDGTVHGHYDLYTRTGHALCSAQGEEQGRGTNDPSRERHPR